MELKDEIRNLAMACLENDSQFIVDVIASLGKGIGKVLVIVDADEGMGIDDCGLLSQKLAKSIEEKGLIDSKYFLEVSTPGIDQPIKLNRQYKKNIGRGLKVDLIEGTKEGTLSKVDERGIVLSRPEGKGKMKKMVEEEIPFSIIKKATVKISFK